MSQPAVDELLAIMARLRDPKLGCPWDLKQTMETIVPHTIEEAYEVADAIERGEIPDILAELGDLLLQIIFYCQIAQENQWFDFNAVAEKLKTKLIERHPHIFAGKEIRSVEEHKQLWQAKKAQERQNKLGDHNSVLAAIPHNLPALIRAQKMQTRAAQVGFDWPHFDLVLAKLKEEVIELEESFEKADQTAMQEELGDILFVCANLARHLQCDAETLMRRANQKFERRFHAVEQKVIHSEKDWSHFSLEELENFWQLAKKEEKE